jgi:hypothetical protein
MTSKPEVNFPIADYPDRIQQGGTIPINMTATGPTSDYAFGYTDAEHARLIRQAVRLAPLTERFFRQAGIGRGQEET